ncbi:MAG: [Synergistaceae bacterium]|nr:[FeFe] hydrogenase H-cluster maturation GTPase HydF [Synergistaceae bacterium]
DDVGYLGEKRVRRAYEAVDSCDLAVLVRDISETSKESESVEREFLKLLEARNVPYIIACNKVDLTSSIENKNADFIYVSAETGEGLENLKSEIIKKAQANVKERRLVSDLISPGDVVILVCPMDSSAPKGRLILPQQQTIREILDFRCTAVICQDNELENTLEKLKSRPSLVITDSQVFKKVDSILPGDVPLTSFSILFARLKGNLKILVDGAKKLKTLKNGDRVLIAEACTHNRQCGDIGTEKIPKLIKKFTGADLNFTFTAGNDFPDLETLRNFQLIVHCGGCMLNERAMQSRIERAVNAGVPIVNYGVLIAYVNGILERALEKLIRS